MLSAGFAFLTCFLFMYEDTNIRGAQAFQRKHGGGPWRTLGRIFPIALISQLFIFPTYFIGLLPWMRHPVKPRPEAPASSCPVLLIHGLYHTPSAWLVFIWKLRKASWNNIHTLRYSSWSNDLCSARELLVRRIQDIAAQYGDTKVFLVGHSLGGLLARSVTADPRCCGHLAGVVTLGAPHHGSKLASLGIGALARSLHPESEEIKRITTQGTPTETPCLSLYSPTDNLVLPNSNLRIHHPGWQEEETAPISHVYMLYAPDVHKRVLSFLEHVQLYGTNTS